MASTLRAWIPRTRPTWLIVLAAVGLLYIPINRLVQGGVVLSLPWDACVPFWPIWAVPYLLTIPWWIVSFIWAARSMDDDRYRAFVVAALVGMLTAYAVFVLYPTYVERPVPQGHGWEIDLIRLIYRNDRLNNAFPSGHAFITVLISLFWWDWRPKLRWLWAAIVVVVILSTLFTGQHNLPDPIGGIIWAYAGYRLGWWWVKRMQARRKEG